MNFTLLGKTTYLHLILIPCIKTVNENKNIPIHSGVGGFERWILGEARTKLFDWQLRLSNHEAGILMRNTSITQHYPVKDRTFSLCGSSIDALVANLCKYSISSIYRDIITNCQVNVFLVIKYRDWLKRYRMVKGKFVGHNTGTLSHSLLLLRSILIKDRYGNSECPISSWK